jgi:hypothetical protein
MTLVLDITPTNIAERIASKIRRTWRDIQRKQLRKKIISLPPAPLPESSQAFSLHMLLCRRDFEMGICAAKSFVLASGRSFVFTFHDDGSLTLSDKASLAYHFPGCVVIDYEESLAKAKTYFGEESAIYKMRLKGVMMLKLIDIKLFTDKKKAILIDSDILFFEYPQEIFAAVSDPLYPNCFNRDIETAYMTDQSVLERICGQPLPERINAGLSVLNTDSINFDLLEKWLSEIRDQKIPIIIHRIEQSLISMLSACSSYKTICLPETYDVSFFKDVDGSVCKHYVGRIRYGFEMEGLHYVLAERNFIARWTKFIKQ